MCGIFSVVSEKEIDSTKVIQGLKSLQNRGRDGFGVSYLIPSKIIPLRIYGQAIGEDEAGNLPSCFA